MKDTILEIIGRIIDESQPLIEMTQEFIDDIADYMCENVEDYQWTRGLFYWTDGSIGVTYVDVNGEIHNHTLFK